MDLMEYKAKELYARYNIPASQGVVADSTEGLTEKLKNLSFPVVVKAQVQTGGRGKAGGIRFAENPEEAAQISGDILGMDIRGHVVRKLLITEKVGVRKEWYLSILLDRATKGPMVVFSTEGGMDIEETAKTAPEKIIKVAIDPLIGIKDYIARYLLSKSGCDKAYFDSMNELLKKLYRLFTENHCMLVEINPLAISVEDRLIALDGKISIDDSALERLPEILSYRDSLTEDEWVLEARRFKFLYIPCEPEGSIGVMSNGSGMIMSCIDMITKQGMKVGAALDLGGGATADRIREGIRIILSNENIKAVFINIFGGITRCDEVAGGVKMAVEKMQTQIGAGAANAQKLILVRFEGTNKEKGLEILSSIEGSVVSVNGLREGVNELVSRRDLL